jgi:hypothetical protein
VSHASNCLKNSMTSYLPFLYEVSNDCEIMYEMRNRIKQKSEKKIRSIKKYFAFWLYDLLYNVSTHHKSENWKNREDDNQA